MAQHKEQDLPSSFRWTAISVPIQSKIFRSATSFATRNDKVGYFVLWSCSI